MLFRLKDTIFSGRYAVVIVIQKFEVISVLFSRFVEIERWMELIDWSKKIIII